jgi:hypothetical protein
MATLTLQMNFAKMLKAERPYSAAVGRIAVAAVVLGLLVRLGPGGDHAEIFRWVKAAGILATVGVAVGLFTRLSMLTSLAACFAAVRFAAPAAALGVTALLASQAVFFGVWILSGARDAYSLDCLLAFCRRQRFNGRAPFATVSLTQLVILLVQGTVVMLLPAAFALKLLAALVVVGFFALRPQARLLAGLFSTTALFFLTKDTPLDGYRLLPLLLIFVDWDGYLARWTHRSAVKAPVRTTPLP